MAEIDAPRDSASGNAHSTHGTGRADLALKGIGLIVASTVLLSAGDVLTKLVVGAVPPLQLVWLRFVTICAMMTPYALLLGGPAILKSRHPWLQILRGATFTGSAVLFVSGLAYLHLAEATAMAFLAPVAVTAFSALLLREKIGVRRWGAALAGFAGVLIIVRPGTDAFQLAALLPVASAVCWALSLIVTRVLASSDNALTTLAWSAWVSLIILTALMPFVFVPVSAWHVAIAVAIGVLSGFGQYLIITAYRFGDASMLAPFSYLLIIWSSVASFLIFAEVPGLTTAAGAVIIIGSGLYTAHRERIRARQRAAQK